jgi:hypothetical protein
MLRGAVNALAAIFLAVALVVTICWPFEWPLLLPAALLAGGCLFERWRYRHLASTPPTGDGWVRTEERFVDPESGRLVAVYYHSATGARRYVETD